MRFRTSILILLLISQPVSAFAGAWQDLYSDQAGVVAGHCDGAVQSTVAAEDPTELAQHGSDQTNCSASCAMCASCTAAIMQTHVHMLQSNSAAQLLQSSIQVPSGTVELLYRPPI